MKRKNFTSLKGDRSMYVLNNNIYYFYILFMSYEFYLLLSNIVTIKLILQTIIILYTLEGVLYIYIIVV